MRLTLTTTAALLFAFILLATAAAKPTSALQRQRARYYHATGYLWAIHHVAFRTVNSRDARLRRKWRRTEARLERVRVDTRRRIRLLTVRPFPPHHALWMCIHGHEAADWHNPDTGHNSHYGGLQMHPDWGYGTSYLASADSQRTQEWAAERGYQASGYSRSWLLGQWFHPDCLPYA